MQLVPGPRQVVREAMMLSGLPRGLLALARRSVAGTVPVHHTQLDGDARSCAPPPLPDEVRRDQPVGDGRGPLLHRTFHVDVMDAAVRPSRLVALLASDMNAAMIPGVARFDRVGGDGRALTVGDEFVVRMPGPWDGPVRVVDRRDTAADGVERSSFRLATLAGHLEAGQIEFAAEDDGTGLRFSITTWARAGDVLADVMYNHLGVAKEIQYQLWVHCCVRAAELAGGTAPGGVEVVTRTVRDTDGLSGRTV